MTVTSKSPTYLDPHFHDEQLIVTLNDFFTGGSGTMSKTLGFSLYFCLKNPGVMAEVQEEIDNATGLKRIQISNSPCHIVFLRRPRLCNPG